MNFNIDGEFLIKLLMDEKIGEKLGQKDFTGSSCHFNLHKSLLSLEYFEQTRRSRF